MFNFAIYFIHLIKKEQLHIYSPFVFTAPHGGHSLTSYSQTIIDKVIYIYKIKTCLSFICWTLTQSKLRFGDQLVLNSEPSGVGQGLYTTTHIHPIILC